jgi:hypothetical protein
MSKEYRITLTRAELEDLKIILEECKREGWHYGRQDYWSKHLGKMLYETNKALQWANVEEGKV